MKLSFLICDPLPDIAELGRRMKRLADMGYQGVELTASHPPGYRIGELAGLSRKIGLPVVSFLSGWSYANEGLCLCSPDTGVRKRAAGRIEDYVRLAAGVGAIVVVGLMQGLRSDEPDESLAQGRIDDGLAQVARTAEKEKVAVVIEPVNHLQVGFNHTAAEAAEVVRRVSSPALGYMLDTIHMNIEERSILQTIRDHGGQIRHFHLCESNGGPFGSGNLDFAGVIRELAGTGYGHFVSVKIYRRLDWEEAARTAMAFAGKFFNRG